MTQFYIVYPGLGKTTLALANTKFIDAEARVFKDAELAPYIGKIEYPNVRGIPVKDKNPDYPDNYFDFVQTAVQHGKTILLVPKQDSYDLFSALNIKDYVWILPNTGKIEQMRAEQSARGDDPEYIENNLTKRYTKVVDMAKKSGKEIIFLKPDQYLSDIL